MRRLGALAQATMIVGTAWFFVSVWSVWVVWSALRRPEDLVLRRSLTEVSFTLTPDKAKINGTPR